MVYSDLHFALPLGRVKSFLNTVPPVVYSTGTEYAPPWEPPKITMGEISIDVKILLLEVNQSKPKSRHDRRRQQRDQNKLIPFFR